MSKSSICNSDFRPDVFLIMNKYDRPYDGAGILFNEIADALSSWYNVKRIETWEPTRPKKILTFPFRPLLFQELPSKVLSSIRDSIVIILGFQNLGAKRLMHPSNRFLYFDENDEDSIVTARFRWSRNLIEKCVLALEYLRVSHIYHRLDSDSHIAKLSISSESKWWRDSIGPIVPISPPIWEGSSNKLLFVGSLCWFPNIAAVNRVILPLVQNSGYRVDVVGKWPSHYSTMDRKDVFRLPQHPAISICKNPASLDEFYARSRLLISPITTGSGVNIKVAHAFMSGIPCLLSTYSVRGYDEYDLPNTFSSYAELLHLLEEHYHDMKRLRELSMRQREYILRLIEKNRRKWFDLLAEASPGLPNTQQ